MEPIDLPSDPATDRPTNQLQRLLPHHFSILELTLQGIPRQEIAKLAGLTPQQITNIQNSPIFQHELARRRESQHEVIDKATADKVVQARQILNESSALAATVLEGQLTHPDPRIQQSAAKDILDRVLKKDDTGNGSVVMNNTQIQVLIQAMKESGER